MQTSHSGWIILHLFENESNHPEESKDDVFCHGKVVVSGAKQFILILTMNKLWNIFFFFKWLQPWLTLDKLFPLWAMCSPQHWQQRIPNPSFDYNHDCSMESEDLILTIVIIVMSMLIVLEVPGKGIEGGDCLGEQVQCVEHLFWGGHWSNIIHSFMHYNAS